ncbi:MAG: DUF3224 domain-containing protein [Tannerella sp.]|jgi:hypothetical protein|nr:DUF3224 domain-containing protein [Tannerella sp.]
MKIKSEFGVAKWDETRCGEVSNGMVTAKASIIFTVSGEMDGKLDVDYLLHYTHYDEANPHNSRATYVGFLTFSGSIGGKSGSFVLEDKGTNMSAGPVSELTVKPDTGTGDFRGISGSGKYYANGGKMVIEIDYSVV